MSRAAERQEGPEECAAHTGPSEGATPRGGRRAGGWALPQNAASVWTTRALEGALVTQAPGTECQFKLRGKNKRSQTCPGLHPSLTLWGPRHHLCHHLVTML